MKLADDWRKIVRKAWSFRLIALSAVFTGLEVAMPFLDGVLPVERGVFAALAGVTSALALIARIMAQQDFPDE